MRKILRNIKQTLGKIYSTGGEVAYSLSKEGSPTKIKASIALTLQTITAGCNLMLLYLLGRLPVVAFNDNDSKINTDNEAIEHMLSIAGVYAGSIISSSTSRMMTNALKTEYANEVAARIIAKYSELDLDFTLTKTPGEFVRRVNSVYELQDVVSLWIDDFYEMFIEIIFSALALFYFDWRIGLVFLNSQFISLLGICYGSKGVSEIYLANQQIGFRTFGKLISRIQNHESIRLYNRVTIEREEGIKEIKEFGEGYKRLGFLPERNGLVAALFGLVTSVGIIALEIFEVQKGRLSFDNFFPIFIYFTQLYRISDKAIKVITRLLISEAGMTSINDFLSLPKEIKIPAYSMDFKMPTSGVSVQFKEVVFNYGDEPIFKGVNCHIAAGSATAIVGLSGVGKTTFGRLCVRSYQPFSGSISINGHDINWISDEDLCQVIGLVPQQPRFPNKPLIAILKEAKPDASIPELIGILNKVKLGEFSSNLNKRLGEEGAKLSGGQLQRLAIAKVLLKKPNILILDEPTSALDTETALEILQTLKTETKGITTIIITHNILSINDVDNIIVLGGGKVLQSGTFNQLKEEVNKPFYNLLAKFCLINGLDMRAVQSRNRLEFKSTTQDGDKENKNNQDKTINKEVPRSPRRNSKNGSLGYNSLFNQQEIFETSPLLGNPTSSELNTSDTLNFPESRSLTYGTNYSTE